MSFKIGFLRHLNKLQKAMKIILHEKNMYNDENVCFETEKITISRDDTIEFNVKETDCTLSIELFQIKEIIN